MKRARLIAILAVVFLVLFGCYELWKQRSAARRYQDWLDAKQEAVVPEVMSQLFAWDAADITLSEFADLVSKKSGLPVELDEANIPRRGPFSKGKPGDFPVRVPRCECDLDGMLRLVLTPLQLAADVQPQRIMITMVDPITRGASRRLTVVYPIPQPEPATIDETGWGFMLGSNVHGYVKAVPGAVIVVTDAAGHERARLVFNAVCALKKGDEAAAPPIGPTPAEDSILFELDKETTLDVVEMPLKDVIVYLSDNHNIPIILLPDIESAGISLDTPITKSLRGITLRSALRLMLKDLELTYIVRHGALIVTTPEDAQRFAPTRAYRVAELIRDKSDVEALCSSIRQLVLPDSWRRSGGEHQAWSINESWLLVTQSDEAHEQLRSLFHELRSTLDPDPPFERETRPRDRDREDKIRFVLAKPNELQLRFQEVPLKDVAMYLQEELNIPILISAKQLEEAAVSLDTPVTMKAVPGSVGYNLKKLLAQLELTYLVRDEVLQITTPEDAEAQLVLRLYDTRQVLASGMSPEQLSKRLRETINPASWNAVGGPGTLAIYRDLLIVSQTEAVHEEVEQELKALANRPTQDQASGGAEKQE